MVTLPLPTVCPFTTMSQFASVVMVNGWTLAANSEQPRQFSDSTNTKCKRSAFDPTRALIGLALFLRWWTFTKKSTDPLIIGAAHRVSETLGPKIDVTP